MSPRPNIAWKPQIGPQTDLVRCPVDEVFYGGARGGGKTDGIVGGVAPSRAQLLGKAYNALFLRREFTQLRQVIERTHQLYTPIGAEYSVGNAQWVFPGGGRLTFAHLDADVDADKYQGHSYTDIYIEELGNFPSPKPIDKLRATLRSGEKVDRKKVRCIFRATGNPGGPGHIWVKERYIDPSPQGYKILTEEFRNPWTGEKLSKERVFIPSKVYDNRYLGTDYIANLQMTGSEAQVRAWLNGDWDIIEGAFFDDWRADLHILQPFDIPRHWTKFRSCDWGSARPFSVGWWAIVSDDLWINNRLVPRGAMIRYREWYGIKIRADGTKVPNTGINLTAKEVGEGIKTREKDDQIAYGVIDPSCFASHGGPSIAEEMIRVGVRWRGADNRRVGQGGHMGGWNQMRTRLRGFKHEEKTVPLIYTFSTCIDSIRTIPMLQHDSSNQEDLDTEAEDHAADEWRYACMSRPYITERDKRQENLLRRENFEEIIARRKRKRLSA